ncbi:MAG: hypothetical protein ACYS76_14325, partial [Planctomycetota bacterium]
GYQIVTGGFTWWGIFVKEGDETVQETVYALTALSEFDAAGYSTEISDAGIYLQTTQLPTGGWENYPNSPEAERNDITGVALRGISVGLGHPVVPDVTDMSEADANWLIATARTRPATPCL